MSKHLANPEEKKKVKIVRKDTPSMNPNLSDSPGSTEYIKGGRRKKDGSREKSRSVEIGKDFQGDYRKTVRKTKKDGSVETKSKKISDKRAERIKKRKDKKYTTINNYGTMKTPNNMGAPNFYVMNPGSPNKKMDTPGGFSYKAESTMNKLGFVDSGINDGHSGINTGTEKEKKYDEFGTEIPDYGRHSDTGKEYIISPKANLVETGKQTLQGPSSSSTIWSSQAKKPKSQRKVAEYTAGTTFHSTRKNKKGENVTVRRVMGDTERTRDKKLPTSYFKENKVYNVETPYTREVLTEKSFPGMYSNKLLNKKKKK